MRLDGSEGNEYVSLRLKGYTCGVPFFFCVVSSQSPKNEQQYEIGCL